MTLTTETMPRTDSEITAYLMSDPKHRAVTFIGDYIILESAGEHERAETVNNWKGEPVTITHPILRDRYFVMTRSNWYVELHNGGMTVYFSLDEAVAAVSPTIPAQTQPASVASVEDRPIRRCPLCGATSDEANFTTRGTVCDDCA
jgi:hypothetical protein